MLSIKEFCDIAKLVRSELKFHAIKLTLPTTVKHGTEEVVIEYLSSDFTRRIEFLNICEMIDRYITINEEENIVQNMVFEFIQMGFNPNKSL